MSTAGSTIPGAPFTGIRRVGIPATAMALLVAVSVAVMPGPVPALGSSASITVDVGHSIISGDGWTPHTTVTITVDRPSTPTDPDMTRQVALGASDWFSEPVGTEIHPRPGDLVTVTDGSTVKAHRVTSTLAGESDEWANTITGIATAGATVEASIPGVWGTTLTTVADGSGHWTFDFDGVWDLQKGTMVALREFDADGDSTIAYAQLPVSRNIDGDSVPTMIDNCPWEQNSTQYDGDGDGIGTVCDEVDRVRGPNRYATAAAVAQMAYDEADEVFIALGTNFPDALVAAAPAGLYDGPVLLTRTDSLPAETVAELVRLKPKTAYVIGGPAVISPAVEQELRSYVPTVKRLAGADRYGTAAAVVAEFFHWKTYAFVALGTNFPDALVAAAAAGIWESPVLLTRGDHVPHETLVALAGHDVWKIFVVGGPAVISDTVLQELAPYGPVERLAGANRYATAAVVADRFFKDYPRAFLAYGGNFPDALVAAAAGGKMGAPVLLVDHHTIPAPTRTAMEDLAVVNHWIVGGSAVIGQDVFDALP